MSSLAMGISYEPIQNGCGHTQYKDELVVEFDEKLLCEECFLDAIQTLINERAVETLADLMMCSYWKVE